MRDCPGIAHPPASKHSKCTRPPLHLIYGTLRLPRGRAPHSPRKRLPPLPFELIIPAAGIAAARRTQHLRRHPRRNRRIPRRSARLVRARSLDRRAKNPPLVRPPLPHRRLFMPPHPRPPDPHLSARRIRPHATPALSALLRRRPLPRRTARSHPSYAPRDRPPQYKTGSGPKSAARSTSDKIASLRLFEDHGSAGLHIRLNLHVSLLLFEFVFNCLHLNMRDNLAISLTRSHRNTRNSPHSASPHSGRPHGRLDHPHHGALRLPRNHSHRERLPSAAVRAHHPGSRFRSRTWRTHHLGRIPRRNLRLPRRSARLLPRFLLYSAAGLFLDEQHGAIAESRRLADTMLFVALILPIAARRRPASPRSPP